MSIHHKIAENVFLPLNDRIRRLTIHQELQELKKSEYWDHAAIEDYQNIHLRLLVNHAYSNVKYYNNLFKSLRLVPSDIKTKADLQKLPILTKEIIRNNCQSFNASNISRKDMIFMSSSGSTSEPLQFYISRKSESLNKAAAIRAWNWMGYKLGDRYVKISMNPRQTFIKQLQDKINNCKYLSSTQLTTEIFANLHKQILIFDPLFIRCYPVPLLLLAKYIKNIHGHYNGTSLKAINTTGSTLHDSVRQEIEEVFRVKIYDSYSCEGGAIFSQCEDHAHYHPADEVAISEYLSDGYSNSDSERPMRLITTDLHNFSMPFIRYDTQDYLVLGEEKMCKCRRSLKNIRKIKGRDSDILKTPSGKYLIVENFVAYFEWESSVDHFQVVQDQLDRITLYLVVNNKYSKEKEKELFDYWQQYIGTDVHTRIEVVPHIQITSSGKRRTVIRSSEIPLHV